MQFHNYAYLHKKSIPPNFFLIHFTDLSNFFLHVLIVLWKSFNLTDAQKTFPMYACIYEDNGK